MLQQHKKFVNDSKIAFDLKHRKTIGYNISKYDAAVKKGNNNYQNFDLAKNWASYHKEKSIADLRQNLELFEEKISERGAKVIWARNSEEAISEINSILINNKVKIVVKSKSMISEEIELNENLHKVGIESIETDLGEFIVQEAGEKPYHILTPAMHKSKEDVAILFNQKFATPIDSSPEQITKFVRKKLRKKFVSADAGITGANFIVADIGGIGLTENEGNGLSSVSFPKIHIVIAGIEKVIASVNELPFFFRTIAAKGTGQPITVYNTLFFGPKTQNETKGPEKMFVILLDNGRTDIFKEAKHSLALKCLRCGACLNACPIYKNVGGYTYNATYSGPIGSVITPFFNGLKKFGHLSFACTVCGKCTEVCPVKIPLHDLLLLNRKKYVESGFSDKKWEVGIKAYGWAFKKRKHLDMFNGKIKSVAINTMGGMVGPHKKLPEISLESFSKQWSKRKS